MRARPALLRDVRVLAVLAVSAIWAGTANAAVTAVTVSSATLTWTTSSPVRAQVAYGSGGLYLYTRSTRATDRIGRWGFASMAVTLILIYLLDSLSGTLPPSVNAICVVGLAAAAIFTSWAWWTDRHREVRT